MRLVDDVMEPFRPIVDIFVRKLANDGHARVDAMTKPILGLIPTCSLRMGYGISPVSLVIHRLCVSLAQAYEDPKVKLCLPTGSGLELSALFDEYQTEQAEKPAA
jgi:CRISPR-associated protein Cas1